MKLPLLGIAALVLLGAQAIPLNGQFLEISATASTSSELEYAAPAGLTAGAEIRGGISLQGTLLYVTGEIAHLQNLTDSWGMGDGRHWGGGLGVRRVLGRVGRVDIAAGLEAAVIERTHSFEYRFTDVFGTPISTEDWRWVQRGSRLSALLAVYLPLTPHILLTTTLNGGALLLQPMELEGELEQGQLERSKDVAVGTGSFSIGVTIRR